MKKIIKIAITLIFLAVIVYVLKFSPLSYYFFDSVGREHFIGKFEEYMSKIGIWAPFIFVGFYVACVVFFVPASVPSSIGGLVFGQWEALGLNFVAAVIGSVITFVMMRFLLREMAEKILNLAHFKKFDDRVAENGFSVIVYLRLMFVPFGYLNAAAGVSKISFKDYFWASMIGLTPGLAVITFLSAAVKSLMITYKQPSDVLRPDIILPLILFIFSFFIPVIIKKHREKFGVTKEEDLDE